MYSLSGQISSHAPMLTSCFFPSDSTSPAALPFIYRVCPSTQISPSLAVRPPGAVTLPAIPRGQRTVRVGYPWAHRFSISRKLPSCPLGRRSSPGNRFTVTRLCLGALSFGKYMRSPSQHSRRARACRRGICPLHQWSRRVISPLFHRAMALLYRSSSPLA